MKTPLTEILGVGPSMAATLKRNGYANVEAVASTDLESLCQVPGIGEMSGSRILASAKELVGAAVSSTGPASTNAKSESKKKKAKSKKEKSPKSSKKGKKVKKDKSSKKSKKKKSGKKGSKKKKK